MDAKIEFRIDSAEKAGYEATRKTDGRESVSSWLRWLARKRVATVKRLRGARP